jgi:hypothetical protein
MVEIEKKNKIKLKDRYTKLTLFTVFKFIIASIMKYQE